MQTASSRIWTQVLDSISDTDNRYAKRTSLVYIRIGEVS